MCPATVTYGLLASVANASPAAPPDKPIWQRASRRVCARSRSAAGGADLSPDQQNNLSDSLPDGEWSESAACLGPECLPAPHTLNMPRGFEHAVLGEGRARAPGSLSGAAVHPLPTQGTWPAAPTRSSPRRALSTAAVGQQCPAACTNHCRKKPFIVANKGDGTLVLPTEREKRKERKKEEKKRKRKKKREKEGRREEGRR